jgi:hypothetical protein
LPGAEQDHHVQEDSEPLAESHPETTLPTISRSLVTRRIQNLTAILNISILRRDTQRALRAFSLLLRCERHGGVTLSTLWELGLEVLIYAERPSTDKAEEFLARVRLTSSDVGRHATTEKLVNSLCGKTDLFKMVALFSALLVLKVRRGKVADALDEANK